MKIWANNVKEGDSFWYERISGLPAPDLSIVRL